jgi:hypothetical protein
MLAGVVISVWARERINSKIRLHQSLQSEADNLLISRVVNSSITLTGALVGLFSLTKRFLVTQPAQFNLPSREQRVRDAACVKKAMNIKAGATYVYEYREPSGVLIGRFEVSSCPPTPSGAGS